MYSRLAGSKFSHVFLHHHSFGYINSPNRWMRMICRSFDKRITHIFLSDGMRRKFQDIYGAQDSILISNAHFVRPLSPEKVDHELVLGHLSNLSSDKGFYECVETFLALHKQRIPVRAVFAGPIQDDKIRSDLDDLVNAYPGRVEYLGPVYGDAKDDFYRRIHLFLFPTKWLQEAQPNVIYEAFAGGASVVAFGRGSIPEMIPPDLGVVVPLEASFAEIATKYAAEFWNDPASRPTITRCHAEIETEGRLARAQYELLIDRLGQRGAEVTGGRTP
jgi:glycosyltransferase involved in cell wall biosynthesis